MFQSAGKEGLPPLVQGLGAKAGQGSGISSKEGPGDSDLVLVSRTMLVRMLTELVKLSTCTGTAGTPATTRGPEPGPPGRKTPPIPDYVTIYDEPDTVSEGNKKGSLLKLNLPNNFCNGF